MNSSLDFTLELIEAYEKKLQQLEKTTVPQLKDSFQLFQAVYRSIYELFINKGIIKQDPYKNDRHLSDIYVPEDHSLSEGQIDEQMPILLSEYDNLLDFLNNYTQFKCVFLNLKKIKTLSALVKYIDWGKLTPTTQSSVTRGVAILSEKIRLGSDALATSSLQSSLNKIEQLVKEIGGQLKTLAEFKREEYKLFLRQRVIQQSPVFREEMSRDEFVKHVKSMFLKAMEGEAFFPELVYELYGELTHADSETIKKGILDKLRIEEGKKKIDNQKKFNLREILFEGIRNLGTASRHLDECIVKLRDNNETLKNRPKSFMERFKLWIIRLSRGNEQDEIFEVEIVDINTTMKKTERIAFNAFCAVLQKKSRFLTSLMVKTSPSYVKIDNSPDEAVYEILERNIVELKQAHERLDALDSYFKTEIPASERSKMRGIKVELGNIKNSIALVNQKMHEYVAKKDEVEQLKKLGIDVQS